MWRENFLEAHRWLDLSEKTDAAPPAWWEELAKCSARVGDLNRAKRLLAKAPESSALPRIMGMVVDRAMSDRQRGRDHLPADMHREFDLARKAFSEYDQGRDESARQALQGIGVSSPFLDWKLLIRGLMAYSSNDDVRALENWSRLDPERYAAQLAVPFRFKLDAKFRAAFSPAHVAIAERRASIISHPSINALRELKPLLNDPENLGRALQKISAAIGQVKIQTPEMVQKIANCFYWLIIEGGEPEDMMAYQRIFGGHPDDKQFSRLQGLIYEKEEEYAEANKYWKRYLDEIARDEVHWPGEHGRLARAMLWKRMGDNAQTALDQVEEEDDFDDFMPFRPQKKKSGRTPVDPPAEQCYRQAIELAPSLKAPTVGLLNLLLAGERYAEAEVFAQRFLERMPHDVEVLVFITNLQVAQSKMVEAAESMKRAVDANPLDRNLRLRSAKLNLVRARSLLEKKNFEEAESMLREVQVSEPRLDTFAKALLVASAYKQDDQTKAEQLLAEATADAVKCPAFAYTLAVEGQLIKLKKDYLKAQQDRFDQIVAEPMDWPVLNMLASCFGFYKLEAKSYRGIGGHEKKITIPLQQRLDSKLSEAELVDFAMGLHAYRFLKLLQACCRQGQTRFRKNPVFAWLLGEYSILSRPKGFSSRTVGSLFLDALNLIDGAHDERSSQIKEEIAKRRKQFPQLDEAMTPRPYFGFGFPRGFPFF